MSSPLGGVAWRCTGRNEYVECYKPAASATARYSRYSIQTSSGAVGFSIQVVNLSTFPITIEEVGFYLSASDTRMVVTEPIL
jgi:hypothetical protein